MLLDGVWGMNWQVLDRIKEGECEHTVLQRRQLLAELLWTTAKEGHYPFPPGQFGGSFAERCDSAWGLTAACVANEDWPARPRVNKG
jgi:hypothetical protein